MSDSAQRRPSWRMALILLAFAVVLASVGAFVTMRLRQPDRAQLPIARTTQTPAPMCTDTTPSSSAVNIRVSNDAYKAHSEPMLAINPANPLNLVGGSKFFTDPARYRFQIGTYTSFDGGCAWTNNGVLPGFAPSETTSDVTVAFGPENRVYVAVLYTDNARD
ncbi:MAG TPA: hypothetical protein VH591_11330, partial [Ktedonobacterales bacterium]